MAVDSVTIRMMRGFTIPKKVHEGWGLKEFEPTPSLVKILNKFGIAGIFVDGDAAKILLSNHQVDFNANLQTGLGLGEALNNIFKSHRLGVAFVKVTEGKSQKTMLCFVAKETHIKELGRKNLLALPHQPYLPIIVPPSFALGTESTEQTIRTREPGILPGKAIGHAVIFDKKEIFVSDRSISPEDIAAELTRLEEAMKKTLSARKVMYAGKVEKSEMPQEDADAFFSAEAFQIEEMAGCVKFIYQKDGKGLKERMSVYGEKAEQFVVDITQKDAEIKSAEWNLKRILDICCDYHGKSANPEFRRKAEEIRELGNAVIYELRGEDALASIIEKIQSFRDNGHHVILIANYLGGLEVDRLRGLIDGLIVSKWDRDSHGAIVSKGVIPGIAQPHTDFIEEKRQGRAPLKDGDVVIIDGDQGLIIIHPEKSTVKDWMGKISDAWILSQKTLDEATSLDNLTQDGVPFTIHFNIEDVDELDDPTTKFILQASEGRQKGKNGIKIGLFRTEYLLAGGHVPQVSELVDLFSKILEKTWGLTVRLPDVGFGTDKDFFGDGGMDREAAIEMNPDMGLRGIRLLSRNEDYSETVKNIFSAAAIVKARLKTTKSHRTISVMVPMVTDTLDFTRVQDEAMEDVRMRLTESGQAFDLTFPLIAMIEIPAAAILADWIFKSFDGASFGTNDLVQFTLAADRKNPEVARIRDPLHPSVLRLMKIVLDEKRKYPEKSLSACGVHAGSPAVAFVYMLLGINELSINRTDYVDLKNVLTKLNLKDYSELAEEILDLPNGQAVRQHLKEKLPVELVRLLGLLNE